MYDYKKHYVKGKNRNKQKQQSDIELYDTTCTRQTIEKEQIFFGVLLCYYVF